MRKVLLGFMTFLMLTPVLACAMAFCPTQASAADQPPCHQTDNNDGPMLALDCMGVDLFQQEASNDISPDGSIDSAPYAWADLVTVYSFRPDNSNGIRGPPDWAAEPKTKPSILLTTQRFRI